MEWGEDLYLEGCTRPKLTQPDRRLPLMEDDPGWKMTFNGRQPLMEDNL